MVLRPRFFLPLILFFVSGFCGLVYEVVWSRMLVLAMGNTTLAVSSILAAFMAGLSSGSHFWGRFVEGHSRHPLRLFGVLEIGTGVVALAFTQIVPMVLPAEQWLSQSGIFSYTGSSTLVRFLFCFCLLVVPTFLMGGTLAAVGKHVIRSPQIFSHGVSLLYGINTAGALLGAVLAGFVLVKALGHHGSIILAASLNLLVGLAAILPYRSAAPDITSVERPTKTLPLPPSPGRGAALLVVAALALSGFCGLAYQVLWTRLLLLAIDNSVYSFTIILAGFLAGIAFGGLAGAPLLRYIKRPVLFFGLIQIGIAVSSFFFPFFIHTSRRGPEEAYLDFLLTTLPAGILLPTCLMGIAYPAGAAIFQRWRQSIGESLGETYAASTAGSVLGAVAGPFIFISVLGFHKSALLLPGLSLLMGTLIVACDLKGLKRVPACFAGVILAVAAGVLMPPDFFPQKYAHLEPGGKLIYYDEGVATTATVFERPNGVRVLYLNGIPEVDTSLLSLKTFRLMGALPALLHRNPQDALMVTFGAGVTSGMAAHFAARIDCVDLASQAREIAIRFADANERVHENSAFSLYIDDARHFIQNARKHYCVIVSDATHPRVYDSWVLFTAEFYHAVKERLTPSGIFFQWLPFHGLEHNQYLGIVRTFASVFEHPSIWCVGESYSLLLATPDALTIDFQMMLRKMQRRDVRRSLHEVDLDNPLELLAYFSLGEEQVRAMTAPYATIMTDNSPAHLFFPFHATFKEQYAFWPQVNYESIRQHAESVIPYLTNISDTPEEGQRILDVLEYYEKRPRRQQAPR